MSAPLVLKFGGAVLGSLDGFTALARCLREYGAVTPLVVVVSALGHVTRQLESLARMAQEGRPEEALEAVARVVSYHRAHAVQLLGAEGQRAVTDLLAYMARRLEEYVQGIAITGELTPRTLDLVRSFGESWALALVAAFLRQQGFPITVVEATELLRTDTRHGMAQPLIEETARRVDEHLRPLLRAGCIVLTQGFVARSVRGEITTMGQESSSLTAVLLAALVGAEEVHLWTDVAGVRLCDPTVVPHAALVPQLSYEQAAHIGRAGLRLLYPRMVEVAEQWGLRLCIRSAFAPAAGGTTISHVPGQLSPLIVSREKVWLWKMSAAAVPPEMRLWPVDGSTLFARWEDGGYVWMLTSSDIPAPTPVEEGSMVALLHATPQQTGEFIRLCSSFLDEGEPVRLSVGEDMRCFVPEPSSAALVRAVWQKVYGECTKAVEAAS